MKLKVLLLLFTKVLLSCSHNDQNEDSLPEWVSSPGRYESLDCQNLYLCQVGEANRISDSQAQARAEIAKVFSVDVSQTTRSETSMFRGEVDEFFTQSLSEKTSEVLDGVRIEENYRDSTGAYSLAVLNKANARRTFSDLLDELDQRLIRLKSENTRSSLFLAHQVLVEREEVHKRMTALGYFKNSPISLAQIDDSLSKLPRLNVSFDWKSQEDSELDGFLKSLAGELGLIIVQEGPSRVLEISFTNESVPFNVEGFEKYQFIFKVEHKFENETLGSLELTLKENGRNFEQASGKAYKKVRQFILNEHYKLNL